MGMEEGMTEEVLDVAIVGGGPAGLTAGIYIARARLEVVLVEKQAKIGRAHV